METSKSVKSRSLTAKGESLPAGHSGVYSGSRVLVYFDESTCDWVCRHITKRKRVKHSSLERVMDAACQVFDAGRFWFVGVMLDNNQEQQAFQNWAAKNPEQAAKFN